MVKVLAFVEQSDAAMEMGPDQNPVFGPGQRAVALEDLEVVVLVSNGPVVLYDAVFLEAKDVMQVKAFRHRTVIVQFLAGHNGELGV